MILKTLSILILMGSISAVHLLYTGSSMAFQVLHQQFFYLPLILASFWYGVRAGMVAAMAASLVYGPVVIMRHDEAGMHLMVIAQIALYFVVALLIGWLSDRHRRHQRELLKNERISALGQAASSFGFEIGDIVRGVEAIYRQAGGLISPEADTDFRIEIRRLQRMVDGLANFNSSPNRISSSDLNDVLWHMHRKYRAKAAEKGVKIAVQPDRGGCPSTVPVDAVSRVYEGLVDNALDFSADGQTVVLRSGGNESEWVLEVADAGPGVAAENEGRLFTTFFTTRPDGYGLSLSSGRKLLRDLGGDLRYRRGENGGAVFAIHIPRRQEGF